MMMMMMMMMMRLCLTMKNTEKSVSTMTTNVEFCNEMG